jgi:hypothetical protein
LQNRKHKQLWWKLKSKSDQSKGMMTDDTTFFLEGGLMIQLDLQIQAEYNQPPFLS